MFEYNGFDPNEILQHFNEGIGADIKRYAQDEALKYSRYIFTHRVGKQQYGYCTHCKADLKTNGLRHNEKTICPKCISWCTVKASGRGRGGMVDEAYFVYYEKSIIDPNTIVARGIYAVKDYRYGYENVEIQYMDMAYYVFSTGECKSMKRYTYYSGQYHGICSVGKWEKCAKVYSHFHKDHIANMMTCCSLESIKKAVQGTPFSWSGWEQYTAGSDLVKFFDLYSKYPAIEYLTKLGFKKLVQTKLDNGLTYSAINWRGKNLLKVLKINKQELNEIKAQNIDVTFLFLKVYNLGKKDGSNLSLQEAVKIEKEYGVWIPDLEKLLIHGSLRRITNYLGKQHEKYPKNFSSSKSAMTTWKDYIDDCVKLGFDITNELILYPKDLHQAHQNTIKQIKDKADKELIKKIRQRAKELKKYCFEYNGLIIRPASSSSELIEEGKALEHCVGRYSEDYAKGNTNIFVIRKAADPKKPYYTVEVKAGEIRQVRGHKNCEPVEDVKAFIEAFTQEKLKAKGSKNKSKIAKTA